MNYDIDFMLVGEKSKGGDAIALRFGDFSLGREGYTVVIIDGGTNESGEKLVEHVQKFYKTDTADIVVSTHPDADHSSGLSIVMEKMNVGELWMHSPWKNSSSAKKIIEKSTASAGRLQKSWEHVYELEEIANRKNIPILEPFTNGDASHSNIMILGPSFEYYEELAEQFDESIATKIGRLAKQITREHLVNFVRETWNNELLLEPIEGTSPQNNSSVILLLHEGDVPIALFTADAGVPALENALDHYELEFESSLADIRFVQVPHHGSKRNVGPATLNRMIGAPLQEDEGHRDITGFVSAPKKSDKHPSKRVINAFTRRGVNVISTSESECNIWYHSGYGGWREEYNPIEALPFYSEVEE